MIDRAYLGESFELNFTMKDPRDPSRTVDSGTYEVRLGNMTIDSGDLTIEGNNGSFRFTADRVGLQDIIITYSMGQDVWKARFRLSVEEIA